MKIKFFEKPPGTEYEKDQVAEFNGWLELTYANRYINDGYAEEIGDQVEQPKSELELTPAAAANVPPKSRSAK